MLLFKVVLLMALTVTSAWAQLPFPELPFGGFGDLPQAQPATVASVQSAINRNCSRTHVVHNACANGLLSILTYWAPTHWVEVTGKTHVAVVQGNTPIQVFGSLGTPNPLVSGGGANNAASLSGEAHTHLHFKEARVYEMPTLLTLTTCGICDGHSSAAFLVNYVSDNDAIWRTQTSVPIPGVTGSGLPFIDFGVWGPIYPRQGKVVHGSEVVAAAHAAARAMHISSLPLETEPTTFLREIGVPSPPPSCFQVAHPRPSQCLPPGASPIYFETARLEAEGKYVFIFWTLKVCCVDPATAEGCRALNGSGAENFCEAPVGPLGFVAGAIPFR